MSKVLFTVPTNPSHPYIHKACVSPIVKILGDSRHSVRFMSPSHRPFENNLHHIVNTFLKGDYDYWLSFDADNPPRRNPLDLIEFDRDIMGCPTPILHFGKIGERPVYYSAYKKKEGGYTEWRPQKGLQKVDAIGTGCFLIARRVFLNKELHKGAFTRKLNEDGTVNKGNDISFCERVTEQGFEIWTHFDYPCNHHNEVEINEMKKYMLGYKEVIDG